MRRGGSGSDAGTDIRPLVLTLEPVPRSGPGDQGTGSSVGTGGLISVPASDPEPSLSIKKTSRRFY